MSKLPRGASRVSISILGCLASLWGAHPTLADDREQLFETRIAPLLSAKCLSCHSEGNPKGGLSLSTLEGILRGGDSGIAMVVGKPSESPIFNRVLSHDGQKPEMPETGEPLSEQETANLRAWIEQGAVWPEGRVLQVTAKASASFWSLQPVSIATPPEPLDAPREWSNRPIDRFVWDNLHAKGLQPNHPADPRTFIRRATFDLWGLPPTMDEVASFERDCLDTRGNHEDVLPDEAVERLIDRLLTSPRYGERWGRHWLDIAHYADTHGFERDQLRPNAWRYRDYVIDSLNADKPYDQFIREQIAGDVIAPNDPQSVIATGFLAAGPWDFVGHVETKSDVLKRAARAGDLDDMVTQVITSTMGVTINCARCHDHKLDPISQREYYNLWSVFAGVKRDERFVSAEEARQLAENKSRMTQTLAKNRSRIAQLTGEGFELARLLPENAGIHVRDGSVTREKLAYHSDLEVNRLQPVSSIPGVKWVFVPDGRGMVTIAPEQPVDGVPATNGHFWDTIANRPLNQQRSTKLGDLEYTADGHTMLGMHANSGITLDLDVLRQLSGLSDMRLSGLVGFGAAPEAASSLADFTVFVDNEMRFQRLRLRKDETAAIDVEVPATAKSLTLIATDGGDGIGSDLLFVGDPKLVRATGDMQLTEAQRSELMQLRDETEKLVIELRDLPEPTKVFAIVTEEKPPIIKVQRRGNPEDEGEEAVPGAFAWAKHASATFGDNASPESQRRLALANWIVHPDNPLTRRVLVNRLWHHHFGQGLVNTPSDFGYGGDRPSHPELLDWLASEVARSGWSLKRMHKTIMLSSTYRQSSEFVPSNASVDGSNRLLWRQNPRRLDAESLRDAVLSVAGKLNPKMGGPGFRDFQYTEAYAPIYEYVTPDSADLYRRSIYRFIVRTTPHQFLTTFDCPDPANFTPARVATTTPLQALALSNNEFMLRQAEHLADRVTSESNRPEDRISRAFQLAFQRLPTDLENAAAEQLLEQQGLFTLCRALLNANEFLYLD